MWTTSTTGLETALAAAIGSTLQQHTNTITNNLKGQAHILHIGNSVSSGSVGSNLHHLSHTSANSNINVNQLQHHHPPPPSSHHHNSGNSPHHNYNSKYKENIFELIFGIEESNSNGIVPLVKTSSNGTFQ